MGEKVRAALDSSVTPPLKSLDLSFKATNALINDENKIGTATMSAMPEKLTEEQLIKYNESINEVVKGVVVRAKVEAGRSKNEVNIAKYQEIERYAVNNGIISQKELDARFEAVIKEDVQEAESVLAEVDSAIEMAVAALNNIENFDPADFTEIYFVSMKLDAILTLKLDSATRNDALNAKKVVGNVIRDIASKVKYNRTSDEKDSKVESPLIIVSNFFAPTLSTSTI